MEDVINLEEASKIKSRKAEPVWIEVSKNNYRDHLNLLWVVAHINIQFKILKTVGGIKVFTNVDCITSVFHLLKSNSIHFHRMKPTTQRPVKFAIKGFPNDFGVNEIKDLFNSIEITPV